MTLAEAIATVRAERERRERDAERQRVILALPSRACLYCRSRGIPCANDAVWHAAR